MKRLAKSKQSLFDRASFILDENLGSGLVSIIPSKHGIIIKGYIWDLQEILDEFGNHKTFMNYEGLVVLV